MSKSKYDWKLTVLKGLKIGAIVFLTGVIAYQWNNPYILTLIPFIEMSLNWIKHRKD